MSLSNYSTVAGSTLLVLLFGLGVYFADDAGNARFNGSFYESATYAPRLEEAVMEVRFTRDASPADRIREVFGQFVPTKSGAGNVTPPRPPRSFASYRRSARTAFARLAASTPVSVSLFMLTVMVGASPHARIGFLGGGRAGIFLRN